MTVLTRVARAAFDPVAATYDEEFTHTPIAQLLRRAVWARLRVNFRAHFRAGMRVLELCCGTGEDALYLARQGVQVVATDASANMLSITREKVTLAGVSEMIETRLLDMNALDGSVFAPASFDGVLSNFGALNCVADLSDLFVRLAQWTAPGARAVLVVMGPFYPWEIARHVARFRLREAFRRFARNGAVARVGGNEVRVWYPSPRRLMRCAAPHFRPLRLSGLGIFTPPMPVPKTGNPPSARLLGDVVRRAARLERRVAHLFPFNHCGDHYILEMERR